MLEFKRPSPLVSTHAKDAIKGYKVEREVVKEVVDPLLAVRDALTYGRLVVKRSTTSYEVPLPASPSPMNTPVAPWRPCRIDVARPCNPC